VTYAFAHLSAVERGQEPLLQSDAVEVGELVGMPASWLS
jgi:hypothetical protein